MTLLNQPCQCFETFSGFSEILGIVDKLATNSTPTSSRMKFGIRGSPTSITPHSLRTTGSEMHP